MDSKPDSIHPLAEDVRTRQDRMKNEASVLAGIEPVRAFLNQHADQLVHSEAKQSHKDTLSQLIQITARLGLYEDALAWKARYGELVGKPMNMEQLRGRYLRGDYRLSLTETDAPWDSQEQVNRGVWAAQIAVMNGDVDEAEGLLKKVAVYRAGQPGRYLSGLLQNCELAVLAHVMGRDELVMPALHRARFVFEPESEMSTRPLEESPNWIGDDEHAYLSLYLVCAIAGSGFGRTALELSKGRDLVAWGGEMREAYGLAYGFGGFYLCLANGGCVTEALELARKDEDNILNKSEFLTDFSAIAFRWGELSIGEQLAEKLYEGFDSGHFSLKTGTDS